MADAVLAAFDVRFKPEPEPQSALSTQDVPVSRAPSTSGAPLLTPSLDSETDDNHGNGSGVDSKGNDVKHSVRSKPKLAQVGACV